jgi:hypothetical protein
MNWSQGGDFTKSLLSLQLQLQTLLEGVGGEETAGLLDALAKLSETERSIVIPVLSKVISRIASGEQRLQTQDDIQLQEFENSLFESVLSAMGEAVGEPQSSRENARKLAVVPGGKTSSDNLTFRKPVRISSLIDLSKARESRKQRSGFRPRDSA